MSQSFEFIWVSCRCGQCTTATVINAKKFAVYWDFMTRNPQEHELVTASLVLTVEYQLIVTDYQVASLVKKLAFRTYYFKISIQCQYLSRLHFINPKIMFKSSVQSSCLVCMCRYHAVHIDRTLALGFLCNQICILHALFTHIIPIFQFQRLNIARAFTQISMQTVNFPGSDDAVEIHCEVLQFPSFSIPQWSQTQREA